MLVAIAAHLTCALLCCDCPVLCYAVQPPAGVPNGHCVHQRDCLDPWGLEVRAAGQGGTAVGRAYGSSKQLLLWCHVRVLL